MNKVRKAQLLVLSRTSSNTILFEDNNSFPRDFYSTFFLPPFLFSFSIRKNIKVNVLCWIQDSIFRVRLNGTLAKSSFSDWSVSAEFNIKDKEKGGGEKKEWKKTEEKMKSRYRKETDNKRWTLFVCYCCCFLNAFFFLYLRSLLVIDRLAQVQCRKNEFPRDHTKQHIQEQNKKKERKISSLHNEPDFLRLKGVSSCVWHTMQKVEKEKKTQKQRSCRSKKRTTKTKRGPREYESWLFF